MSDERITDLILQRLERIEGKLDSMQTSGCQAGQSSWQFAGTHRGTGEAAGGGGMNNDREYWNGLAITVGAAAALCAALLLCGCSTIRDAVDEYRDWRDSQTNAPAAPPATPEPPTQPDTPAADEADYSAFTWAYGGFNGSRAALSEPRIASLRMSCWG